MSGGFEDLGLLPELVKATHDMGWLLPSDVQDEAIPLILGGGDVMVAAETGSGKTGAFALPAIQLVHEARRATAAAAAVAASTDAAAGSDAAPALKRARLGAATLDGEDRSPMLAIAPDGLTCQCRQERDWGGVRATVGVLHGKAYFEAEIRDEGLCRFGWSTKSASLDLGTDKNGFGFGGTGKKSNDRKFDTYGEAFGKGDVIGCFVDIKEGGQATVSFSKNGVSLGDAFTLPRVTGALFPTICMKNAECAVRFGGEGAAAAATDAASSSTSSSSSAAASTTHCRYPPADGFVGMDALPPASRASGSAPALGAAAKKGSLPDGPVCLVIEPARDLAEQTAKQFESLAKHVTSPSITHSLIIGGVDAKESRSAVSRAPDIVTATPGKLMDLVEGGKLSLSSVRLLILDEADRFCDAESYALIMKLYAKIVDAAKREGAGTSGERLQVAFFSATLHSPEIGKLSDALCTNPTWVDLKGKDSVPDTVHHVVIRVNPDEDRAPWGAVPDQAPLPALSSSSSAAASPAASPPSSSLLWAVPTDGVHAAGTKAAVSAPSPPTAPLTPEQCSEAIKRLKPAYLVSLVDSLAMEQCMIFCRTNVDCDKLEEYLMTLGGGTKFVRGREKGKENRYSCVVLAGMRSMEDRRRNLEAFKEGDVRFLICTDVAARGLDIKELPYVINMTLPDEAENYIHRIGRVGRADRMGLAISLVATVPERVWYHRCASKGKGCTNTAGCSVWYDEPALLQGIHTRLQLAPDVPIPAMVVTRNGVSAAGAPLAYAFALPKSVADLGAVYGGERGDTQGPNAHVEAIRSQVQHLAGLEVRSQNAFLALKMRYAGAAAAKVAPPAAQ